MPHCPFSLEVMVNALYDHQSTIFNQQSAILTPPMKTPPCDDIIPKRDILPSGDILILKEKVAACLHPPI
jgi:hypothetical protein